MAWFLVFRSLVLRPAVRPGAPCRLHSSSQLTTRMLVVTLPTCSNRSWTPRLCAESLGCELRSGQQRVVEACLARAPREEAAAVRSDTATVNPSSPAPSIVHNSLLDSKLHRQKRRKQRASRTTGVIISRSHGAYSVQGLRSGPSFEAARSIPNRDGAL